MSAATSTTHPPPEWVARLREVDPIRDPVSYLDFRWYAGRWVLYEMVPVSAISDPDLLSALCGPDPLTLSEPERIAVHQAGCSAYQWSVFQTGRRYARPSWVIQGSKGGHLIEYDEPTKELAKAVGLPAEPPKVGALPYAPFDERVVRQILNMSRLVAAKNDLAELKRNSTPQAWRAHVKTKKQEARAQWTAWLNEQFSEVAEHFVDAYRAGEYDSVGAPATDVNELVRKDEEETAHFVEHGTYT